MHLMRLTADGLQPTTAVTLDDCCVPPLCGVELCGLICSFIQLLPRGPMWDRPKAQALDYYNGSGTNPCEPACPPPFPCPTLVLHAIYTAMRLRDVVHGALWPAYRESNPFTAVTTLDDWLERLNWQDCFNQHCRAVLLGELTPYEIMGECGPVFCPVDTDPRTACAVKKGIIAALTRAQMGVIRNLDGINWIIEPLGATVFPMDEEQAASYAEQAAAKCPDNPPIDLDCCCPTSYFTICNSTDFLPACPNNFGPCDGRNPDTDPPAVAAYIDRQNVPGGDCNQAAGLPQYIWPGVLAAECIIRSLLPRTCPNVIYRCCNLPQGPIVDFDLLLLSGDQQGVLGIDAVKLSGDVGSGRLALSGIH